MNCPVCNNPNPTGATHCGVCSEVFNKSAADRYMHAQRRASRQENPDAYTERASTGDIFAPIQKVFEFFAALNWKAPVQRFAAAVLSFVTHHAKSIAMIGLLGASCFGLSYLTSPGQRLKLFGSHLEYDFSVNKAVAYLVGYHTELKSWSERSGRLDTPLETLSDDEMGNVTAKAFKLDRRTKKVRVSPREWILNRSGQVSQSLPLSHASLKPGAIILDAQGSVVNRINTETTRIGRSLPFIAPHWPGGSQRTGARWNEPIEWTENMGDWQIFWKGKLTWRVGHVENWGDISCLRLTYVADVQPHVVSAPGWAKGAIGNAAFQGHITGDACFDRNAEQIYSNDMLEEGLLQFTINDIYRIPADLRVGRVPRHRFGESVEAQPGSIVLQIKNRLGIHKS